MIKCHVVKKMIKKQKSLGCLQRQKKNVRLRYICILQHLSLLFLTMNMTTKLNIDICNWDHIKKSMYKS